MIIVDFSSCFFQEVYSKGLPGRIVDVMNWMSKLHENQYTYCTGQPTTDFMPSALAEKETGDLRQSSHL